MTQRCGSSKNYLSEKVNLSAVLMTIQGVLQHLSPTKLVMKSFPLNAERFGLFSFSQQGYFAFGLGFY